MSKASDPSLYESNYERTILDRYWTDPWITRALLEHHPIGGIVWEPAAGRGDMSKVFLATGRKVIATDIDSSEYDALDNVCGELDFLNGAFQKHTWIDAIVTNPPFNKKAQQFVERALEYDVMTVAMLLRSEFRSGKTRRHLFGDCPMYAGEIVLTSRPRWDWWFRDKPKASPRHNFSWFVWDMRYLNEIPYQQFHYVGKSS